MGLEKFLFKTRSKMDKFKPIKKLRMVLERWKDEKTKKMTKTEMTNAKKR